MNSKGGTLLIMAHQDDEAISCGGLILNREDVVVHTIFSRSYNYGLGPQYKEEQYEHYLASLKELGVKVSVYEGFEEGEPTKIGHYRILEKIEDSLIRFAPTEVVVHSRNDLNQDHRFLAELSAIALRPANLGSVKRVLACHGVDGVYNDPTYFVPLTEQQEERKLAAMEMYTRERRVHPHPRSCDNLRALHHVIGASVGVEAAEPYTLIMQREI